MFSIIRIYHLHVVLIWVIFFNVPICVVDMVDNIKCGGFIKSAEDIVDGFNVCGIHRVINLVFGAMKACPV